jgi:GTP-binding protein HflX
VRRNRDLQRQARERVPFPVIALVGYTNAGKSTLFNNLTDAEAFAEDLPFATLDPTLRAIKLDNGHRAIVSDTVGFISNLPTQLEAAFRATIEEVSYADVIVHVMDVHAEDYEAQRIDVVKILGELGIDYDNDPRILELHNKIDLLAPETRESIVNATRRSEKCLALSAHEKRYTGYFLQACRDIISRNYVEACFDIDVSDGRAIAWLYENAVVTQRRDDGEIVSLGVNISNAKLAQFRSMFDYDMRDSTS